MSACSNFKRDIFIKLNFELLKEGRKYTALCLLCKKVLANTATERLKAHRNRCHSKPTAETAQENLQNDSTMELDKSADLSLMDISNNDVFEIIEIEDTITTPSTTPVTSVADINRPITVSSYTSSSSASSPSPSPSSACATSSFESSSCSSSSFKKPKTKNHANMQNFLDKTTKKDEEEINILVARFFFGCNIPLNVIDAKPFKDLISKLRPAYSKVLPSRKTLSNTLLDKEYERQVEKVKNQIGKDSVLLIDGWKNTSSNSKLIVTMLHNGNGEKAFLNAWDLSTENETAEKLSEIIEESINMAQNMYGTSVYAVVSDNAANMMKMGRLVYIWHSNCSAHVANLLAKDITNKEVAEKVTSVLKEFRHPDLEKLIIEKGGTKIKTPAETRWCSLRDCFRCFKTNLTFMRQLVVDAKKIKTEVKSLLFDDLFIERVDEEILLLDPVCQLLNKVQSTNCSVAEAADFWLSLNLPDDIQLKIKFEERKKKALNLYALSAYFLNPFMDNTKLSAQQTNKITSFLFNELDGEGLRELDLFINCKEHFYVLKSKNIANDAGLFWRMASLKYPTLSAFAKKLINIPASSAQIERVFSNWKNIHSDIRNRLTFDRSKKLIHIYYSLKMNRDYEED